MLNIEDPPLLWAEDLYCTLKGQPKGAGECLLLIAYNGSNFVVLQCRAKKLCIYAGRKPTRITNMVGIHTVMV